MDEVWLEEWFWVVLLVWTALIETALVEQCESCIAPKYTSESDVGYIGCLISARIERSS